MKGSIRFLLLIQKKTDEKDARRKFLTSRAYPSADDFVNALQALLLPRQNRFSPPETGLNFRKGFNI